MKNKQYTAPQLEILLFSDADIVTASGGSGGTTLPELPLFSDWSEDSDLSFKL